MPTEQMDHLEQLQSTIEAMRAELARLAARVAELEQPSANPGAPRLTPPAPEARPKEEPIPEEVLLVISAAVAAFLGKRGHIRQVRLAASTPWAQQGRVSIQASHRLEGGW